MRASTATATLITSILASAALPAQATPAQALLALSKNERTLAIIDPVSLKIVARVPVGQDPHEVIASTDGRFAYVSNYGGGAYNTIAVVDLVAQKALPPIDLGALRGPHGLTFVGGKLWFTAEAARAIGSYDPAAKTIDWIFGTGQNRTHMIYVLGDLQRIVTSNVNSATMSVIERSAGGRGGRGGQAGAPQGDWDQTVIPVGRGAEGFDISPDGKEIWVANAQDGTVSVIDLAGKRVIETLAANVTGANRLKFTPDGRRVLIAATGASSLTIIDAATRKDVKRLEIGRAAAGIQLQPDGARAFVACSPDNFIAVVDLKTLQIVGKIDVGANPDGLAWAARR
jgi:YVTN family beta-propeller protein